MLSLLLPLTHAGTLSPGEPLDEALGLHITQDGLKHLGEGLGGVLPEGLSVEGFSTELSCSEEEGESLLLELEDLQLQLDVEEMTLKTEAGMLRVEGTLALGSSEAALMVAGDCSFLTDLDETCGLALPTVGLHFSMGLGLSLRGGELEVSAEDPTLWVSPIGNPLQDCLLSSAFGALLAQDAEFISGLLMGLVEPELAGLGEELELTLAESLSALELSFPLSLGDQELELELFFSSIQTQEEGLFLGIGTALSPLDPDPCVEPGLGSSLSSEGWPQLQQTAWGGGFQHDVGLYLNRDFTDHLLWSVWSSGLLCLDVAELTGDLGISFDAGFFSTLYGEELLSITDSSTAIELQLNAPVAPSLVFGHDLPFAAELGGLGLDHLAVVDGRTVRLARVDLSLEAGLDPGISSSGLSPELLLDLEAVRFTESYNELLPAGFSQGLADFLPTILEPLGLTDMLDGLLPSLSLPTFQGLGLQSVDWLPSEDGQWQGGFAMLSVDAVEPLELQGCSSEGESLGCDDLSSLDPAELIGCGGEESAGCSDDSLGCGEESEGCEEAESGCEDSSCSTQGQTRRRWPGGRLLLLGFCVLQASLRRLR